MPPETEPGHFNAVLAPFAKRRKLSLEVFTSMYQSGKLAEPELDEYFLHDSSVRESGHDTTYRLDGRSAHICTVDLNSLLYKYEVDIAEAIRDHFNDALDGETSKLWLDRAESRRRTMDRLMWNDAAGFYFDYDFVRREQTKYESATTFFPLWAGCASLRQCERLM